MNKSVEVVIFPDGRLDVPNASHYLGLSQKTLAMMRCQGTGPEFIKLGRIFYFKEDLDQWILKNGKRSSTAKGALATRTNSSVHIDIQSPANKIMKEN